MTGLPQISYVNNGTNIAFTFKRGPNNFTCEAQARIHDNLATSGLRERIYEATDLLISFEMNALRINDDLESWTAFYAWGIQGGTFALAPSVGGGYFNCVIEDDKFPLTRKGPGTYAAKCQFRVVPDNLLPSDNGTVMDMFYQIAAPVSITSGAPTSAVHGTGYSFTFTATGGSGYAWIICTTNGIPAGLTLGTAGVLSGTPTTAGTYTFTVKVMSGIWAAFSTVTLVVL